MEVVNDQVKVKHLAHGPEASRVTIQVRVEGQLVGKALCFDDCGHSWIDDIGP